MRVGIIGDTGHTGYVVNGLADLDDVEVIGVSPGSEGESVDGLHESVRDHSPDATRYQRFDDLLAADPDLVVVSCQFGDLARRSLPALERGCHVYTEKPIATTLEDLRSVRAAYDDSAGELAAMFGIRYDPAFYTAYQHVADGAVGTVRLLNGRKSYRLGEREAFYRTRETYGGTIPWVGIHAIDWVHWYADREARTVRARHSRQYNRDHGDLEVTGVVDLELEDEVLATVTLDYLRPENAPTHGDDRIRVVGTEGVIEVRDGSVYLIDDEAEGRRKLATEGGPNPFADFVRGIRGETEPLVTAEESFRATETSLHARNAADEDDLVRLE